MSGRSFTAGLCLLLVGAARAAEAPAKPDLKAEIGTLASRLLANPLDAAAASRLEALRKTYDQQRRTAFGALAAGMQAYLDGRFALAGRRLAVAAAWDEAATAADELLLRKLGRILDECRKQAASSTKEAGTACADCGDLGWADCPGKGCYGTGTRPCPTCRARGTMSPRSDRPCPACKGTGALPCAACRGRGVVPCTKCGAGHLGATGAARDGLGPNETRAIRALIAKARYLSHGGMDLESPRAFRPSPKLQRPAPPR